MVGEGQPSVDEVRARIVRVGWNTWRPVVAVQRRMLVAGVVGLAAAAVAHLLVADWLTGTLIGLGITVAGLIVASWPLRDHRLRAALELYSDHIALERDEWKLFTGTKLPSGFAAMERWLDENPDAEHGRAAMLAGLGRLDEAEAAIASRPVRTAQEHFERELLRQQIAANRGGSVDFVALRREMTLLSLDEQRHRRECVAILEASVATETGGDPLPILAAAIEPDGPVNRRAAWALTPIAWLVLAFLPSWAALMFSLL
ncbi:MAG: hypothetical protein WCK58_10300 [Chloroflexota bacterium]